jgi:hypothetical protein
MIGEFLVPCIDLSPDARKNRFCVEKDCPVPTGSGGVRVDESLLRLSQSQSSESLSLKGTCRNSEKTSAKGLKKSG